MNDPLLQRFIEAKKKQGSSSIQEKGASSLKNQTFSPVEKSSSSGSITQETTEVNKKIHSVVLPMDMIDLYEKYSPDTDIDILDNIENPILVAQIGQGRYFCIDGNKRVNLLLKNKQKTIAAFVVPVTDFAEALSLRLKTFNIKNLSRKIKKELYKDLLLACGGDAKKASEYLGINLSSFYRVIKNDNNINLSIGQYIKATECFMQRDLDDETKRRLNILLKQFLKQLK